PTATLRPAMKTKPNTIIRTINTFVSAAALLALCAECANAQSAQQAPATAGSGFSFAVYGDSRSMMYLPYKADQEAEARDLMVDMFELVKDGKSGRAKFILSTGDLVWWGKQGGKPSDNPYWKLVNEDVLKQLPAPDDQMRAAGLPGRVFPAVGNHEVWDDSDVQGLLSSFPYLKKFGVSDKQLTYKFDYNDARFIFLWTGPYDYRAPTGWSATRPTYEEQMKQLKVWLDEAKAAG